MVRAERPSRWGGEGGGVGYPGTSRLEGGRFFRYFLSFLLLVVPVLFCGLARNLLRSFWFRYYCVYCFVYRTINMCLRCLTSCGTMDAKV